MGGKYWLITFVFLALMPSIVDTFVSDHTISMTIKSVMIAVIAIIILDQRK